MKIPTKNSCENQIFAFPHENSRQTAEQPPVAFPLKLHYTGSSSSDQRKAHAMKEINSTYISSMLRPRKADAHKGDFGKVLIFAGSPGMAGAAVLCGRSALKSGAGLVQYLLPSLDSPLLPILQCCVPEATCLLVNPQLRIQDYQAIACGSGLSKSREAVRILSRLFDGCRSVLVTDADALNLLSESEDLAEHFTASESVRIITPHIGEAKRLLHSKDPISSEEERVRAACTLAEQYRCICVLKGAGTLVVRKNGSSFDIYRNTTGNPGMATGGSGDSLAGLIASLAAQGYSALDAACMGVWFHGKAGDLAAEELGEMGMISSDIVHYIPYALKLSYHN